MDKFGRTLVMLFMILIFIIGAQMALRISIPQIRQLDRSLAVAIESTL